MARNKAHEAVQLFTAELQKITSCIAPEVWQPPIPKGGDRYTLAIGRGPELGPLQLKRKRGRRLFVELTQMVEWDKKLSTIEYIYSIAEVSGPLVDFHYHPGDRTQGVHIPHVHVYADADERFKDFHLHKRHIPTGRVALEDVVQWMIEEMGVIPLKGRWKTVLATTRKTFRENRSWAIDSYK